MSTEHLNKKYAEIISDITNRVVVQLPNRQFPGIVIQGDELFMLKMHCETIFEFAQKFNDNELLISASYMKYVIQSLYEHLEKTLKDKR